MERLKIQHCPVCGGTHFTGVMTCKDFYASGEAFELQACDACGFTFTQEASDEASIGSYYETPGYISHTDTNRGIVNRLYHCVRAFMLRRKARFVAKEAHRQTGRLLDIGAGTGYFAHTMQHRGWQIQAVEKSAQAREFAKQRFDIDLLPHTALDTLPADSFDVITLWHVMEHIQPLNELWETVRRLLTGKGVLIVAAPNRSSFDAVHYGPLWAAYDVPRHLWHFTPATIQQIASRHGFVMAARRPMPFDAFYISMLSERNGGSRMPFLRGFYTGTRAWLSSLAQKERSSSMIYVFRKKR